MTRNRWIIFCLAYIIGLSATNLFVWSKVTSSGFTLQQLPWLGLGLLGLGAIALTFEFLQVKKAGRAISLQQLCRRAKQQWLGVGIIIILAVVYFQLRIPQPQSNDVGYQVTPENSQFVTVLGKVITEPRLNSSQRLKFLLRATKVDREEVSGKLYATLPLLQGTGLYPGQNIRLKGNLYLPQANRSPSGFDFKSYLANQGVFTGIQGFEAIFDSETEPSWGWWKIRKQIVQSQLRGLGSPTGQLVSSMVLGRKAVDFPPDLRDRFIEAGLAHVLAASGFHVSLLLGIILKLTSRIAPKPRLAIGIGTLIIYLGLTGIQASVLRACLMGIALLLALTLDTKVKPLGSLLLAATIILLLNPLLIGDLGFQLSFLATFGLIVIMPGLLLKLDWLPSAIATLVAVPLAASIWVLPLLSYQFNSVATYSIAVNIICTPLIMIISLGGMISAIAALIMPSLGSAIAWLLLYPAKLLIAIVNFVTSLPGSDWAIGQISLGVLLTIYSLFSLIWLSQYWRQKIKLILLFILALIIVPVGYRHFNLTQITILTVQPEPVVVVQDRGKVILINSSDAKTARYKVLPFLTQQGINQLDYAIDLNSPTNSNWQPISDRLAIKNFVTNSVSSSQAEVSFMPKALIQNFEQAILTNSLNISIDNQLSILKLATPNGNWLIADNAKLNARQIQHYIQANFKSKSDSKPTVLIGRKINSGWLELKPQTIIAVEDVQVIERRNTNRMQFFSPEQDGAIHWTPREGISPSTERSEW